ncbi:response regulator [Pokkaliibacter sp. MBI-7]|uniref:hybrid sensor histidine kinase/response regulator n=1 Tax=Pokkaliibacter sp. MBI-7 TaxID=3040600 RepID=UPI00244C8D09|nr:response regulator [Pokkaliibacter sp. MBI-7]MDH2432384.1 response regulator [Pokkaliibacter sp. MBI-7]
MNPAQQALRLKLLAAFRSEAAERLNVLGDVLAQAEQSATQAEVEQIFREIHSLKGAARAVSLPLIEELCHSWESLFASLRRRNVSPAAAHLQLCRQASGMLRQLLADIEAPRPAQLSGLCRQLESGQLAPASAIETDFVETKTDLETNTEIESTAATATEPVVAEPEAETAVQSGPATATLPPVTPEPVTPQTVTSPVTEEAPVAQGKASEVSVQPEPLAQPQPVATGLLEQDSLQQWQMRLQGLLQPPAAPPVTAEEEQRQVLRVDVSRFDGLMAVADTLQQTRLDSRQLVQDCQGLLQQLEQWRRHGQDAQVMLRQWQSDGHQPPRQASATEPQRLQELIEALRAGLASWEYQLGHMNQAMQQLERNVVGVTELMQQELQAILILPCSSVTEGMAGMVQELAETTGKAVRLQISGAELKVDKRVLDGIRTPLLHLLRNAVDHGIEAAAERQKQGKASQGSLCVRFVQDTAGRFELQVEDDGGGMNIEVLKRKALAQRIVDEEALSAMSDEAACQLAFHSGLSTSAMITDLSGRGLGLAIVREKVERLGGHVSLLSVPGRGCRFTFRLPVSLATYRVVLVQVAGNCLALPAGVVERVLRISQEALKTIERRLSVRVGDQLLPVWPLATLLHLVQAPRERPSHWQIVQLSVGSESLGLLVDEVVGDQEVVIKSLGPQLQRVPNVLAATQLGDGRIVPVLHPQDLYKSACLSGVTDMPLGEQEQVAQPRVLVAEDSITSRSLLKMILESAGYQVITANDGVDAWERLRQESVDLLVSDVEMPRMDGFELTARLRADRRLENLPVILVTALSRSEDRERGLEVGANAYIVKSGFDQGNLLDVVRQLV